MTAAIRSGTLSRRLAAAALAGATVGTVVLAVEPRAALAQSQDELDRARSLFSEGLSLEAAGNWAAALAKFEDVRRVKLTPQVRFHIARCQENLGRLSEALGEYRLAEYEADAQGLAELDSIAQARQQLEARIPKVVITRGQGAEQSRVQLDGVELGEIQIGEPVHVDPGPHRVTARLPDNTEFEQSFSAKVGETAKVELVVPEGLQKSPYTDVQPGAPTTEADRGAPSRGPGALPWIIGGVGVASLAASGVFFYLRNDAENELDDTCRGAVCPQSVEDTQSKGETFALLAPIALGVGVAGIGVATVLFIAGGSDEKQAAPRLPVDFGVAATGRDGAVTVRGRF